MFGEREVDHESTRTKVAVSGAGSEKGRGREESIESGLGSMQSTDGMKLLFVQDNFLSYVCGCHLPSGNGIDKFCAEPVMGDAPCWRKSHLGKPKVSNLAIPAWYLLVKGKGRGGIMGLCDRYIREDSVTDPIVRKTLDEERRLTPAWSTLIEEHALKSVFGKNAIGVTQRRYIAQRLKEACTPFKKRVLDMDAVGTPRTSTLGDESSTDSWVKPLYENCTVPTLERIDLDTLKSPSSVVGTNINICKAVTVLESNLAHLEIYLQGQQQDLEVAMSGFRERLNSLGVVNAALNCRIGYADGFGDEYGVDSAFGGLHYLQDQAGDLTHALGGTQAYEDTPYFTLVKRVTDLDSDMVAAKAGLDDIDVKEMKEAHSDLKTTLYTSMGSLKTTYLQPLLKAHQILMDPRGTIVTRVEALEEKYRNMSIDKDLFGGLMAGTFGSSGNEDGGAQDVGKASARLVEVERSNTALRSEVDELRRLVKAITLESAKPNNEGQITAILGRLSVLEASEDEGVAIGNEIFANIQQVERKYQKL
jgi:hypothetical protein